MSTERLELPQGTLDLLILKVLSLDPMHGWAISERLRQVSKAMLQIPQGSIYPALHRLERRAGSRPNGGRPTTIGRRNTTNSRNLAAGSSRPSPTSGLASRRQWDSSST